MLCGRGEGRLVYPYFGALVQSKHILHTLLIISNFCFVVLYAFVTYHNRLAADDFHFVSNLHQYGIWEGMLHEYSAWSSRYSSVLVNHFFLSIQMKTGYGLILFGMLSLVLMVSAWQQLIKQALDRMEFPLEDLSWSRWNLAILMTSILYYFTVDIGETWHWLCSAATYLWSVIAWIYVLSYLLNQRPNIAQHLLAILAVIYIGGAAGPLSLITLVLIPILTFFLAKGRLHLRNHVHIIAIWFILAFSFFLLYRAEGNAVRTSFFEDISIWESAVLNVKMSGIVLLRKLRLSIFLVCTVLFIPNVRRMIVESPFSVARSRSLYGRAILAFAVVLFFYQWPITYMTQDIAAERALLPISTAGIIITGFVVLRRAPGQSIANRTWTVITILSFAIMASLYQGAKAIEELPLYTEAYNKRMDELAKMDNCVGRQGLLPLPTSGILKSAELDRNPQHFSNQHLREALNIPCQIYAYPPP